MSLETVQQGLQHANSAGMEDDEKAEYNKECEGVKSLVKEYNQAREYDKRVRGLIAIDRRYAAGTVDDTWAVTTNIIGSHIDILTSFLYAKDPDVTVRRANSVDAASVVTSPETRDFARTMELVVSRLWKQSRLKTQMRKTLRSCLSARFGVYKAVMRADAPQNPEIESELNTSKDNIERLQAANWQQENPDMSEADRWAKINEIGELVQGLAAQVEASKRYYMAIDVVPPEEFQVSLDVRHYSDHLDADWNANAIYVPFDQLKAKFPRLSEEELAKSTAYHQRPNEDRRPMHENVRVGQGAAYMADEADQYVTNASTTAAAAGSPGTTNTAMRFGKIVEVWDKRVSLIKTVLEGCPRWARDPYAPPNPSTRFYPYFFLGLYEVDGERIPQSVSSRLQKLMDEYSSTRSNFRIARERAIPAILFNSSLLGDEQANKIVASTHQEYVPVKPLKPDTDLRSLFIDKPYASIDMRLFDTTTILSDMERVSGVQEAQQSSMNVSGVTATQANIANEGSMSRTGANRDVIEAMLSDFAWYTAEVALSGLPRTQVQRICGAGAFWPEGLPVDDLLNMVEIEIEAGSTGKPRMQAEQQAWAQALPVLKQTVLEVRQAISMGDIEMATALSHIFKETVYLMNMNLDPADMLPAIPASPVAPLGGLAPTLVSPPGTPLGPEGAAPTGIPSAPAQAASPSGVPSTSM